MFNKSRWPKKSPLAVIKTNVTKVDKGRYVFSWGGGGGSAGASEGRVISESEHQKGRVVPLCKLFKGRALRLF